MNAIIYHGGIGLNNKIVPHRLKFGKDGVAALEEATDVLIDSSGEIASRKGSSLVYGNGPCHSLCKTSGGFYVVEDRASDSALYKAVVDMATGAVSLTGIASGFTRGKRFSYTEALDGKVYFSNGFQHGYLVGHVASPWTDSDWEMTDVSDDSVPVLAGTHLDILSGRILFSVGDELLFTEYGLPGRYNHITGRVRFESEVIMVCAVQSGVFVSDLDSIYFLKGSNPDEWTMRKVTDYPAKPYGNHKGLVDSSQLGLESTQMMALFATEQGPCLGSPDGAVYNLINKVVSLPADCGSAGCVMVVDETLILQSSD